MRMIVRMTQVDRIISKFGGLTRLADALGHKHPTTVQGWRKRGVVPLRQIARVVGAAKKRKISLKVEDLVPTEATE